MIESHPDVESPPLQESPLPLTTRGRIAGIGACLPNRVMTNHDLEALCDTNDEWIRKRTGIHQRHIAEPGQGTLDLALPAAREALEQANVTPSALDAVLVCTTTPHQVFPATANLLQGELGANHAAAWDINAACTGFLAGLTTANALIAAGVYQRILVVGAEVSSSLLTWKNRDTSVLFGDGAGAVVLEANQSGQGFLAITLGSDGANANVLHMPGGGSKIPVTEENLRNGVHTIYMDGRKLFEFAVRGMTACAEQLLQAHRLAPDDIALIVPHQANGRIIQAVAERLAFPMNKVILNIDRVGNTVAASIPLALHEGVQSHALREGDYVLFLAFGAGLSWGGALYRW